MTFENVVTIQGDNTIPMKERYLYAGPMGIQDIESLENRLIASGVNYLLIQADTTIPCLHIHRQRFARGYCLFVRSPK